MCKNYSTKQIKSLSKIIINLLHEDKIELTDLFEIFNPVIGCHNYIIGLAGLKYKTKKYRVLKSKTCTIVFRLNKEESKKINLNPWHRYSFNVYQYDFYEKNTDKYLFTRIIFISDIKSNRKRKSFEISTILRLLMKLDYRYLINIEKFLFGVIT